MAWTRERLEGVVRTKLHGLKLIVVANREPYVHRFDPDGAVRCTRPASGLTTALDPVMQAAGGTWVAHGSGEADRLTCDGRDGVMVPPESPRYRLRRVWLTPAEEEGYYAGFANSAVWPLCHQAYTRPRFDAAEWECYRDVNRKFADAVLEEAADGPALVFVQDYHFALLPRMLKHDRPDLTVAHFWHVPWPHREQFRVCPWPEEFLDGLLGSDLLAFHVQSHCNNFLDTVDRTLECRLDHERFAVDRAGHRTLVRPYPISVDPAEAAAATPADAAAEERRLRRHLGLGQRQLLVGVDRLDYIKGIPERVRAIDRLLTLHPRLRGRFTLVQVGAPSRTQVAEYRALDEEVCRLAEQVNRRHGDASWRPVVFWREHLDAARVQVLYRAASACVVSSLHDGMNLVAKEFVAARADEMGVLLLSKFAGASRELTDALPINPFDLDGFAETLREALIMPEAEQRRRMRRMRAQVEEHNVYRWAGKLLGEAARLAAARPAAPWALRLARPALNGRGTV
jgi:trehalose 6-phosphate synthase